MHKSVLTVLKKNRISMFDGLLEIFGTSQNQGEYHTNHPQPCHMWIFLSIHFGRSNYAKQIQRQPPRTAQTTKGKKNSPVSISVFISMTQTTSARCFFQQLPTLNHHALRPESRYISPNCFQSLPLHPCHGPTDVPSAYREQRNMCMYIQMCIYNVCVGVSQNYGFS